MWCSGNPSLIQYEGEVDTRGGDLLRCTPLPPIVCQEAAFVLLAVLAVVSTLLAAPVSPPDNPLLVCYRLVTVGQGLPHGLWPRETQ